MTTKKDCFSVESINLATANVLNTLGKVKQDALDRNVYGYITENFKSSSLMEWQQSALSPMSYVDRIEGWLESESKKVNYIGINMLDFVCGKDILEAKTQLNEVATDMSQLSHSLGLFTGCGDMSAFISGFRADDSIITERWSTLQESYGALKERTDQLTVAIQDFQTARDYLTCQPNLCYDKYGVIKQTTFEKATEAYDAMKAVQAKFDIDDRIVSNPLTPIENNCDDEAAFAQQLAKDTTIDEKQLKDYLLLKAIQMLKFDEDERLWIENKWKNRLDDINRFICMCMRLCSQKINSWTRIIALIYSYLMEKRDVVRITTPRAYFIMYMEKHFKPSKEIKRQSIGCHFKVSDDDKNVWFSQFDTLFNTAMATNSFAVA